MEIIIAGIGNTRKQQEALAKAIKDNFGITVTEVDTLEQPDMHEQGKERKDQIVAAP